MLPSISTATNEDNFALQSTLSHTVECVLHQVHTQHSLLLPDDVYWLFKISEALQDLIIERASTPVEDYPGAMLEGPFVVTDPDLLAPLHRAIHHVYSSNRIVLEKDELTDEIRLSLTVEQDRLALYLEHIATFAKEIHHGNQS